MDPMLKSLADKPVFLAALVVTLAAALAAPMSSASAEDLTVISKVTTGKKGNSTTATQYITTDKLRTSDGRYDTITEIASGRMIHIDNKKKEYWETTLAEMQAQFAEVERMLEENPMMARMLGAAAEAEVRKGTGTMTVAGYTCQQYLLSIGKLEFELWATTELRAPELYYDSQKMVYAAIGPMASRFEQLYDEMKKIDGFPLRTKMNSKMMGFKLQSVSEATEVRKGPIPPGTFGPPAGYKKKKPPFEKE